MRGVSKLIEHSQIFVEAEPILPAGTRCFFDQDSAPTGWTRDTSAALDDRCIRIVTGARSDGGSWTILGLSGGDHSHSYTQNVLHGHSITVGSHSHSINAGGVDGVFSLVAFASYVYTNKETTSASAGVTVDPTGVATGTTSLNSEGISSDGTWRPLHRDLIVAVKD